MKGTYSVLLLACCLSAGCSRKTYSPAAPTAKIESDKITFMTNAPQLAYLAVEPVRERKSAATGLSGRLAWNDELTARVFPAVSGRITEILAHLGQPICVGGVLAKIKSPDFGQAQADARKAAADLNLSDRALARNRELLEHGAAARKDLEAAEADHVRAISEKERTQATLALYGGDGTADVNGLFSLKAPVSGVVVEKTVNPGQEVRSDQVSDKPLFVVSDPTRLWLFLDVSETDAAELSSNQEVIFRSRALPDKVFHGRIEVLSAGLDATTRTIKARCIVDNSENLLRAEMYVSADVGGNASGAEIPTQAIFSKGYDHYVFVELAPGQFQRRAVKLGLESNGRSVVTDGLAAKERIVIDGGLLLEAMLEGENP